MADTFDRVTALDSAQVDAAEPHHIRQWVRAARAALLASVLVLASGYLGVVALLSCVVGSSPRAEFSWSGVLVAAVPGWLAVFQVPLRIEDAPLTALPLLPTALAAMLIAWVAAKVARRVRLRKPEQLAPVILVMGLSHALLGASFALLLDTDGSPVRAVPWLAFVHCGSTAALAALVGTVDRGGVLYLLWQRLSRPMWLALREGVLASACVIAAGAIVFLAAFCVSLPELQVRSVELGSAGAGAGAALLTVLYVPNAVVAGWAFATGAGFSMGATAFTPFGGMTQEPLPVLPLFGVLPDGSPPAWLVGVLVVPVLVGVALGVHCRRVTTREDDRVHVLVLATVPAMLFVLSLALLAGGRLGGVHGPFVLRPVLVSLATAGWLVVVAVSTVWLLGVRRTEDGEVGAVGPLRSVPEGEQRAGGELGAAESVERGPVPESAEEATAEEGTPEELGAPPELGSGAVESADVEGTDPESGTGAAGGRDSGTGPTDSVPVGASEGTPTRGNGSGSRDVAAVFEPPPE